MTVNEQKILYESPEVEIHETQVRSVICTSTGGQIGEMTQDEGSWD